MEIQKLHGEEFKLISGSKEEFDILMKWATFYEEHTTKRKFSIEETTLIVELISRIADGTEQGVYSYDQLRADSKKLGDLLRANGYKPRGMLLG